MIVGVWTEKRPGLGEDAEPTLLHHQRSGRGLIGVYDGLGGSGTRSIGVTADGRKLTNAYVAARLAHLTVHQWFVEQIRDPDYPSDLHGQLVAQLEQARSVNRTKLSGSLLRDLPTTVALIEYQAQRKHVDVTARWAGDSRCYLMTPEHGIQQLSLDDSAVNDPLATLIADQPMTNVVSASEPFVINEHPVKAPRPCVLVCATDGFFNYVDTPALFEYHVLGNLLYPLSAPSGALQWADRLARWIRGSTADDASLALVALGFKSTTDMCRRFQPRFEHVKKEHFDLFEPVPTPEARNEAREASWEEYRRRYMELAPSPSTSGLVRSSAGAGRHARPDGEAR